VTKQLQITVLSSSRHGLGLEDAQGHNLKVLALALDGQVLALVMQVLALALKKRSWPLPLIEATANTILKLEKSPEHFQISDADFAVLQIFTVVMYAIFPHSLIDHYRKVGQSPSVSPAT